MEVGTFVFAKAEGRQSANSAAAPCSTNCSSEQLAASASEVWRLLESNHYLFVFLYSMHSSVTADTQQPTWRWNTRVSTRSKGCIRWRLLQEKYFFFCVLFELMAPLFTSAVLSRTSQCSRDEKMCDAFTSKNKMCSFVPRCHETVYANTDNLILLKLFISHKLVI